MKSQNKHIIVLFNWFLFQLIYNIYNVKQIITAPYLHTATTAQLMSSEYILQFYIHTVYSVVIWQHSIAVEYDEYA